MPDPRILVLNTGSGDISVIDPASDEVVGVIAVGEDPRDMVYAAHGHVFVTLAGTGEVAAVDLDQGRVAARIKVGDGPGHIYVHPVGNEIWVANDGSGDLTVVNAGSHEAIATIPSGAGHHKIAFTSDGARAFATNIIDATVTVVDATRHKPVGTVAVVKGPHGIAVTPDDRHVLVCNNGAEVISVIGVAEGDVVKEIKTPPRPNYIRIGPDRSRAYVTHKTGAVSAIALDRLEVQGSVDVGEVPERIVVSPNGARVFVNDTKGKEVAVIDGNSMDLLTRVAVEASGWHQGMTFAPDGNKLYAVNHGADSVSVLDTADPRVLKRIVVGAGPSNIITVGG